MSGLEELKKIKRKAIGKRIIGVVMSATIAFLYSVAYGEGLIPMLFVFLIGIMITTALSKKDQKDFNEMYKKVLVFTSFQEIFTDVYYNPERGIDYDTIDSTEMIYMGVRFSSNDYIKAKYKNINFESADIHIEGLDTGSDGRAYKTLFKGQWFIFDFNKQFKADVQVCTKDFRRNRNGILYSEIEYNKVSMEDMEFNKEFRVYAQNELDAFYVLTPNTVEKIKELKKKIDGRLLLCFVDNRLHVGLYNNKDLFEANVFNKLNFNKEKNEILNNIKTITDFVDILDLDNDLFKR